MAVAAVLVVSDRASTGERADEVGPLLVADLQAAGHDVLAVEVVADEVDQIREAVIRLAARVRLVLTTGGTGLGPRDVTPEACAPLIERQIPGIAEAMRAAGRVKTPMADLTRGLVGVRGPTVIANVPGSPKGARENLAVLLKTLDHVLDLVAGATGHGDDPVTPSTAAEAVVPDSALAVDPAGALAVARGSGRPVVLATAVGVEGAPPCTVGMTLLLDAEELIAGTLGCSDFDAAARSDARAVLRAGAPVRRTYVHDTGNVDVLLTPHLPGPLVVVMGATPVADHAVDLLRRVGFDVQRLSSAASDRARVLAKVDATSMGVHTDHDDPNLVHDVATLLEAGVGAVDVMGSRRHVSAHLGALEALGADVTRVHTPAGLDLGGREAAEIALSIVAGCVARRHGRHGERL